MTKNLFDLTYELASELGILVESTATGGSTTTLDDSVILTETDDHWNKGTVWILADSAGSTTLPVGQYAVISDFDNGNNRCTIGTVTNGVASGDTYAIAHRIYTLGDLISAVNRAIRDVGPIPTTDTTTIDTAAAQTEYDLPIAANTDLREVWLERNISDADDNQWYKVRNWYIQRTAVGTADTLVFGEQPAYPRDVKLVYMSPHVRLVDYDDKLSETIRYERVVYKAAVHAMKHYMMKTHEESSWFEKALNDAQSRSAQADLMYPIRSPKRLGKMLSLGYTKTRELAPGENTI